MRIACPGCEAGYDFPIELIAGAAFEARCPGCGGEFRVERGGAVVPTGERRAPAGEAPSAAIFARTRTMPGAPAAPARPLPAASEAPPDEALAAEPSLDGYLYVRGAPVRQRVRRRQVTLAARFPPGARRPQARVISIPATFGRPRHGDEAPVEPALAPVEVAVVSAAPAPRTRRRLGMALAGAGAVAASALLAFVLTRPVDPVTPAPAPAAPATVAAAPGAAAPIPPATTTLDVEVQQVEPLPERHAAVVHGQIFNGTDRVQTAIRLEATLRADDVPKRRREVWCCEPLEREAAVAAASDPRHPHFARDRDASIALRLEPGDLRQFSILFPALDDGLLNAKLDVTARIKDAVPAPPSQASATTN